MIARPARVCASFRAASSTNSVSLLPVASAAHVDQLCHPVLGAFPQTGWCFPRPGFIFSKEVNSMAATAHYRNLVFGSGEAGKYLSWTLAKQGEHTAVVERKWIGGS